MIEINFILSCSDGDVQNGSTIYEKLRKNYCCNKVQCSKYKILYNVIAIIKLMPDAKCKVRL